MPDGFAPSELDVAAAEVFWRNTTPEEREATEQAYRVYCVSMGDKDPRTGVALRPFSVLHPMERAAWLMVVRGLIP